MIIAQKERNVTKSQEFETIKYGVSTENLAMLFQMLRTNLYSDLHGSIIREVASNVDDSHIEAGKPDAIGEIEWVVANRMLGIDTQLIVRDFGVGLSPDRMRNVYGNYLSSTKRDSNDQTGGFGLGSKSPFAYTDSFFVETIFDGVKSKYLCYIDTSKLGAISLLGQEPTSEPNMTEIIIPIKKDHEDFLKFQEAIKRQLAYFPNFKFIGIEGPEREILYEDDNCIILKTPPIKDTHIVLGKVAYVLDKTNLVKPDGIMGTGVGLKFPVGTFQPTMSREGIFWDEASKAKLEACLRRARKSIKDALEQEIHSETDYCKWYALAYTGRTRRFHAHVHFSGATVGDYKVNGKVIPMNSNQCYWFAGHNLRAVTTWKGSRSRKATGPDPEYSAVTPDTEQLATLPAYRLNKNLNARTASWLFTQHPDGFLAISHLEEPDDPKLDIYYEETKKWMASLPCFDDVVVPDTFAYMKSGYTLIDSKDLAKQRKLEGKFLAKKLREAYDPGNDLIDKFEYNMYESKFEDHKKTVIVYGFQEDNPQLCAIAAMLSSSRAFAQKWHGGHSTDSYLFLKIGRQYAKQFAEMPNAYYIDKVLGLKTPLNTFFADIATAFRAKHSIHTYHILQFFSRFNLDLHNKYLALHKFIEENALATKSSSKMLSTLLSLCGLSNLNQEMEGIYQEIKDYFEGVELLMSVNFDMHSVYHKSNTGEGWWAEYLKKYVVMNEDYIRKYLIEKGKAVDSLGESKPVVAIPDEAEQVDDWQNPDDVNPTEEIAELQAVMI